MLFDRAHERVAFELTWQGDGPVWDWGEVEDAHGWGKLHYEQLARVHGTEVREVRGQPAESAGEHQRRGV